MHWIRRDIYEYNQYNQMYIIIKSVMCKLPEASLKHIEDLRIWHIMHQNYPFPSRNTQIPISSSWSHQTYLKFKLCYLEWDTLL